MAPCRSQFHQPVCAVPGVQREGLLALFVLFVILYMVGIDQWICIGFGAASSDRLLTTREAAQLLNVSTRTLQRMRSEQRIVYVVLRGKCRYRQSEIDRLLDECTVNEDAATPQELKRNHTLRTGGTPKGRRT